MKPYLETCFSPAMSHLHDITNLTVVVVDVFRATSCFVSGLANGVKSVKPVATVEECTRYGEQGYVTAGERDGEKIEGFVLGNSPFDYSSDEMQGQKICATTTNGSRAVKIAEPARQILVGAFLNIGAIAERLKQDNHPTLILCSGWKNRFSMEDTLFAGALAEMLGGEFDVDDDATIASRHLYSTAKGDLRRFLESASHYQRLGKLGLAKDMDFCLELDHFDIVPSVMDGEVML